MLNKLLKEYNNLSEEIKEYYTLQQYVLSYGEHEDLKEFDLLAIEGLFGGMREEV